MKAWEAPGFVFYTEEMQRWLNGYVPAMADTMCAPKKGRPATDEAAAALRTAQAKGAAAHRATPMKARYP